MIDVPQIIATCIAAAVTGIGASYLTFRLTSSYTAGRDKERWLRAEQRLTALEEASLEGAETRERNAVNLARMSEQMGYLLRTVGEDGKHGLRGDLHGLREDWSPILIELQVMMKQDRRRPNARTRSDD